MKWYRNLLLHNYRRIIVTKLMMIIRVATVLLKCTGYAQKVVKHNL